MRASCAAGHAPGSDRHVDAAEVPREEGGRFLDVRPPRKCVSSLSERAQRVTDFAQRVPVRALREPFLPQRVSHFVPASEPNRGEEDAALGSSGAGKRASTSPPPDSAEHSSHLGRGTRSARVPHPPSPLSREGRGGEEGRERRWLPSPFTGEGPGVGPGVRGAGKTAGSRRCDEYSARFGGRPGRGLSFAGSARTA